jgi:hypothetical protein
VLARKMPMPARNMFLAARMRVARDGDELLRFAPRTETGIGSEAGEKDSPVNSAPKLYFDDDAADILNRQAPLALLRVAAVSSSLPANLQLQAARAAWVRSILVNDTENARETAPVLSLLAPYLKPYLDGYLMASDDHARGFAAVWLLLNNPGMRTSVASGAGRASSTPLIDNFRDNWWCAADMAKQPMNAPLDLLHRADAPEAGFLSPSQRSEAQQERGSAGGSNLPGAAIGGVGRDACGRPARGAGVAFSGAGRALRLRRRCGYGPLGKARFPIAAQPVCEERSGPEYAVLVWG